VNRMVGVGSVSRSLVVVLFAISLAPSAGWAAEPAKRIDLDLAVSQVSSEKGEVGKGCQRLYAEIKADLRVESCQVVERKKLSLGLDEVGAMELPNGRKLQVRPLVIDDRGALIAVDLEGGPKADMRVQPGHLVVIGAQRHAGGKLVVTMEPSF